MSHVIKTQSTNITFILFHLRLNSNSIVTISVIITLFYCIILGNIFGEVGNKQLHAQLNISEHYPSVIALIQQSTMQIPELTNRLTISIGLEIPNLASIHETSKIFPVML